MIMLLKFKITLRIPQNENPLKTKILGGIENDPRKRGGGSISPPPYFALQGGGPGFVKEPN